MLDLVLKAQGKPPAKIEVPIFTMIDLLAKSKICKTTDTVPLCARQIEIIKHMRKYGSMGAAAISKLTGQPTCQTSAHFLKLAAKGIVSRKRELGAPGLKYIYSLINNGAKA